MTENTILYEYALRSTDGEVGIEIELEGRNFPMLENMRWTSHSDGSLRGEESIEYVLSSPVPRKGVAERLSWLKTKLKDHGTELMITDRCGVHVHINVQELTHEQVMCFICLYLIMEEPLVKFCGEQREGNYFCLRVKDADYIMMGLNKAAKDGTLRSMMRDTYRYASINVTSLAKFGSLEFRAFRSTEDIDQIATWAAMLCRIKDQSKEFANPREMVEQMSAAGAEMFVDQVMGEYAELLQCPEIAAILMSGVRSVQDIAYVKPKPKRKAPVAKRAPGDGHRIEPMPQLSFPPSRAMMDQWDHRNRLVAADANPRSINEAARVFWDMVDGRPRQRADQNRAVDRNFQAIFDDEVVEAPPEPVEGRDRIAPRFRDIVREPRAPVAAPRRRRR